MFYWVGFIYLTHLFLLLIDRFSIGCHVFPIRPVPLVSDTHTHTIVPGQSGGNLSLSLSVAEDGRIIDSPLSTPRTKPESLTPCFTEAPEKPAKVAGNQTDTVRGGGVKRGCLLKYAYIEQGFSNLPGPRRNKSPTQFVKTRLIIYNLLCEYDLLCLFDVNLKTKMAEMLINPGIKAKDLVKMLAETNKSFVIHSEMSTVATLAEKLPSH